MRSRISAGTLFRPTGFVHENDACSSAAMMQSVMLFTANSSSAIVVSGGAHTMVFSIMLVYFGQQILCLVVVCSVVVSPLMKASTGLWYELPAEIVASSIVMLTSLATRISGTSGRWPDAWKNVGSAEPYTSMLS